MRLAERDSQTELSFAMVQDTCPVSVSLTLCNLQCASCILVYLALPYWFARRRYYSTAGLECSRRIWTASLQGHDSSDWLTEWLQVTGLQHMYTSRQVRKGVVILVKLWNAMACSYSQHAPSWIAVSTLPKSIIINLSMQICRACRSDLKRGV